MDRRQSGAAILLTAVETIDPPPPVFRAQWLSQHFWEYLHTPATFPGFYIHIMENILHAYYGHTENVRVRQVVLYFWYAAFERKLHWG